MIQYLFINRLKITTEVKVAILKNNNKKFTPIEISITIESQKEVEELTTDLDYIGNNIVPHYLENTTLSLIKKVGSKLNPYKND